MHNSSNQKRRKKQVSFNTRKGKVFCLIFFNSAKDKFGIDDWMDVYLVIEEDGTEVDDEEYFATLQDNTNLMLLFKEDIWSPEGPAYM